jgi:hypothetical protein
MRLPLSNQRRLWLIKLLLRLMGTATVTAFLAMLLPPLWMASIHERLGLGSFPHTPVVDYLARSTAALYGFHGVLLLIVANDPLHYRRIVTYIGVLHVTFGVMLIALDLYAGMPWWWTALEGPSIIPFGAAVLWLNADGQASP